MAWNCKSEQMVFLQASAQALHQRVVEHILLHDALIHIERTDMFQTRPYSMHGLSSNRSIEPTDAKSNAKSQLNAAQCLDDLRTEKYSPSLTKGSWLAKAKYSC